MDSVVASVVSSGLILLAMYSITSLAGLFSERSGVANISLEGTMIMGGMMFAILMQFPTFSQARWGIFVSLIISIVVGMLFSQLLALSVIVFLGDQIISGTALNMLAPAISILVITQVFNTQNISIPQEVINAGWANGLDTLPIIFLIVVSFIFLVSWVILNKTHWGLRLKATGENPYSVETSGVSVKKVKWVAITITGALASMGGVFSIISMNQFFGGVNGSGFISLGILILGRWKIVGIGAGAILMSIPLAFVPAWDSIPNVEKKYVSEIMEIIPFIIPLISLMIFKLFGNKIYQGPKTVGRPFNKNLR